ncbi:MAG: nuclear transport factor 2 family protein [Planctomycetota bacterium]|jgi:hypothetical protein
MKKATVTVICLAALAGLLGTQPAGDPSRVVPDHPPVRPAMPPGHPIVEPKPSVSEADPEDVVSIDAIISAYYDVISGPAGEERDWGRFHSLFIADARFITGRPGGGEAGLSMTPEQFVEINRRYFERGGYFESELHRRLDEFRNIAHVFSTYEARRKVATAKPYVRGINSIQLINDGRRWWIVSVMWNHLRPAEGSIPARYLPPEDAEDD